MTDLRFNDVVIESTGMIGPEGEYHIAVCSTCSENHKAKRHEFNSFFPLSDEEMEYVAEMKAWKCCHEGDEPIDGFPESPRSEE